MKPTRITDWLKSSRPPNDLYELLGCHCFEPDSESLASRLKQATRDLFPYQNHADAQTAQRAMRLQLELGRTSDLLADPAKRQAYRMQILAKLRTEYKDGPGAAEGKSDSSQIQKWLESEKDVHPDALSSVTQDLTELVNQVGAGSLDQFLAGTSTESDTTPEEISWFVTSEDIASEVVHKYVGKPKPGWRRKTELGLLVAAPVVGMLIILVYLLMGWMATAGTVDQPEKNEETILAETKSQPLPIPPPKPVEPPKTDSPVVDSGSPVDTSPSPTPTTQTGASVKPSVRPKVSIAERTETGDRPPAKSLPQFRYSTDDATWPQLRYGRWKLDRGVPVSADGSVILELDDDYSSADIEIEKANYSDRRVIPNSVGGDECKNASWLSVDNGATTVTATVVSKVTAAPGTFRAVTYVYRPGEQTSPVASFPAVRADVSPEGSEIALFSPVKGRTVRWSVVVLPVSKLKLTQTGAVELAGKNPRGRFSRTGKYYICGGEQGDVGVLVRSEAGSLRTRKKFSHTAPVKELAIHEETEKLVVITKSTKRRPYRLVLWQLSPNARIAEVDLADDLGNPHYVDFNRSGNTLTVIGESGYQSFDTKSLLPVSSPHQVPGTIRKASLCAGGNLISIVRPEFDPPVVLLHPGSGKQISSIPPEKFRPADNAFVRFDTWHFARDGSRLFAGVANARQKRRDLSIRDSLYSRTFDAAGRSNSSTSSRLGHISETLLFKAEDLELDEWRLGLDLTAAAKALLESDPPRRLSSVHSELVRIRNNLLKRGEYQLLRKSKSSSPNMEQIASIVLEFVKQLDQLGIDQQTLRQQWSQLIPRSVAAFLEIASRRVEDGSYRQAIELYKSVELLDDSQLTPEHRKRWQETRRKMTAITEKRNAITAAEDKSQFREALRLLDELALDEPEQVTVEQRQELLDRWERMLQKTIRNVELLLKRKSNDKASERLQEVLSEAKGTALEKPIREQVEQLAEKYGVSLAD